MSAYLNTAVKIDTMVCTKCGTESFAWLAEVFSCPVCGDFSFECPLSLGNNNHAETAEEDHQQSTSTTHTTNNVRSADIGKQSKKRKRSLSDHEIRGRAHHQNS